MVTHYIILIIIYNFMSEIFHIIKEKIKFKKELICQDTASPSENIVPRFLTAEVNESHKDRETQALSLRCTDSMLEVCRRTWSILCWILRSNHTTKLYILNSVFRHCLLNDSINKFKDIPDQHRLFCRSKLQLWSPVLFVFDLFFS